MNFLRIIRWLIVTCMAFSLLSTALARPLMAGFAAAEVQPVVDASPECCCGTADAHCCGMACCISQLPGPDDSAKLPNSEEYRSQLMGWVRAETISLGIEQFASAGTRHSHRADAPLAEGSLQALHIRLDA